jgi:hypothetical protein
MPSATTADSNDSIPPSKAIVKAGCISSFIVTKSRWGKTKGGKLDDIAPNLLPTVSTGSFNSWAATVVNRRAINDPGILRVIRGHRKIISSVVVVMAKAYPFIEWKFVK